ncbi:anti-sigma regulatory factor [Actinoplanes sp. SE50]|uniref:ATP-binding protein n=1 Tax=unclassified Actinoplanes TaxID=2626549 RepID=UPI00023ECE77|nr:MULTISPECIES: ATP-binding protein [unclassified Actinoplanes]AEV84319.1 histidine kinase [Actinoplanes sp. SE50/110]ATO82711.1 anti-sigma regulatory factor [Actinoplanes sp. SE50]SLM00118.1 anti-sigma regulatory factor [Actinoplanes sp. SE50/110]
MNGWITGRPPAVDEVIARWDVERPPQLQDLRRELQQLVRAGRIATPADADDVAERLVIVVTELTSNALRHGQPPTIVMLFRSDGQVIVDVVDHDENSVPAVDRHRAPARGGLGLQVVQRLAVAVGWYAADRVKHVWASLTLRTH